MQSPEGRNREPRSDRDAARAALCEVEAGLDALPAGGGCALRGGTRDRVGSRLADAASLIETLCRDGHAVGAEEARLAVCRARLAGTAAGC